jgi:hypothetical protein
MIENACPFAPDEIKPEVMTSASNSKGWIYKLINFKLIFVFLTLLALTLLYNYSYPSLEQVGSRVLYQDGYIVKMSFYTYMFGMISYFIRERRRKKRVNNFNNI